MQKEEKKEKTLVSTFKALTRFSSLLAFILKVGVACKIYVCNILSMLSLSSSRLRFNVGYTNGCWD